MNIQRLIVGLVVASFIAVATVANAGWEEFVECQTSSGSVIKMKIDPQKEKSSMYGVRNATNNNWIAKNVGEKEAGEVYAEKCSS